MLNYCRILRVYSCVNREFIIRLIPYCILFHVTEGYHTDNTDNAKPMPDIFFDMSDELGLIDMITRGLSRVSNLLLRH